MSGRGWRSAIGGVLRYRRDFGSVAGVFGEGASVSGELPELLFQGAALRVARRLQISEGDGLGRVLGGDRATQECVVVEHSHLAEVAGVVPHRDVLSDVCGEDR